MYTVHDLHSSLQFIKVTFPLNISTIIKRKEGPPGTILDRSVKTDFMKSIFRFDHCSTP